MRIGLVIPNTPRYSETFFRNKIKGLSENGHETILFVGPKQTSKGDISYKFYSAYPISRHVPLQLVRMFIVLLTLFLRSFKSSLKFWKLERRDGTSIRITIERLYKNAHILSRKLDWLHFGFATMMLERENVAAAIGAKMAVSFRGYDICIYPLKNNLHCYHKAWSKLDKVHTISDDLLSIAGKRLGLPKTIPAVKITPAIEVKNFCPDNSKHTSDLPLQILTVARLHWKKGLDYAIETMALLQEKGIHFHYTIVGDGEAYEYLSFLIHQLKLQECIKLIGKKSHEAVVRLMQASDVYLQPSVSEGFCNAVLEAQASGLLCVVSDAEGLPENVLHEQTGWVVPKRDMQSLADKISDILTMDVSQLATIRQQSISRVCNSFNLEQHFAAWENFYCS